MPGAAATLLLDSDGDSVPSDDYDDVKGQEDARIARRRPLGCDLQKRG
jgi:hypothetical protein